MLKLNFSYLENGVNLFLFYDDNYVFKDRIGVFEIVMSVFFVVSMVISVIGNVSTCAVIVRDRSMKTPTNYYLFNLAIADLMTALFIPVEITVIWIPDVFGKLTGHIVFLFWDLLCNCSVLTILALTIERYIVISKPFLRHTFVLSSRVIKILVINWAVAISVGLLNVFYVYNVQEHMNVYIYFNSTPSSDVIVLIAFEIMIFFIIPMVVITMLYILITLKLKTKHSLRHSPTFAKQNRSKAIKMLAAIAACFFICWSPFCIIRIMAIVPKLWQKDYIQVPSFYVRRVANERAGHLKLSYHCNLWTSTSNLRTEVLSEVVRRCVTTPEEYVGGLIVWQVCCYLNSINSYASTAVNPILYNLMSHKFRRAFKELLKGRSVDNRITSTGLRVNRSINNVPTRDPDVSN